MSPARLVFTVEFPNDTTLAVLMGRIGAPLPAIERLPGVQNLMSAIFKIVFDIADELAGTPKHEGFQLAFIDKGEGRKIEVLGKNLKHVHLVAAAVFAFQEVYAIACDDDAFRQTDVHVYHDTKMGEVKPWTDKIAAEFAKRSKEKDAP